MDITTYRQTRSDSPYGNHVSYTRGMGVKRPDIEAGLGRHADDWNAILIDPYGQSVKLWVTDFDTSFSLSGESGQSRHTRQFFPRNFQQPTVTIKGQMPNNYQYNRLAAFIRNSHAIALGIDAKNQASEIAGLTQRTTYGTAVPTVIFRLRGGGRTARAHQRGKHRHQSLEGYVKKIDAGGERFNNAPNFQFDFVVAFSQRHGTVGIYEDSLARGSEILPWMDIFKAGYQGAWDEKTNAVTGTVHDVGNVIRNVTDEIGHIVGDIGDAITGLL